MARPTKRSKRIAPAALTPAQAVELTVGPPVLVDVDTGESAPPCLQARTSAFASEHERREAWLHHREALLAASDDAWGRIYDD